MSTAWSPFSLVIPTSPFCPVCVLRFARGFWPFANTHYGERLLTWDNSQRTPKNADEAAFLQDQIDKEVKLGHYSQLFGPDLLPGMYSMPIHAVPKPGSKKF